MNLLNDISFQRLQGALDASNIRQRTIADNIANADTPYFKRSDVAFEEMLQEQMNGDMPVLKGKVTDSRHFVIGPSSSIPTPVVNMDQSTSMNNNQNNVDVDKEMSLLAENQLRYNAYIQQVNEQIKMMRVGVEGR
ncbi:MULTISPECIES: flagellar basal body rod protein FlgB [Paenibacillus]|jgi:flagellar basal-body rod protein FlgB|uniref:Flagellar basal body rod protein FlgB n=4 Tax=Paenibacillus TaxID=44249 RepID=A0A0M9BJG8_9BACL|nr:MULTISPECIES: flagellar basal body rod protein FlgB [Paenibacillus]OPG98091.1 flagellar basal-body rod protein FlgB [Chryseobacterium mucoviscidosis]KOY13453.1 flagellar biosynthesis protein FlgB [Paenibacillus xylanivorans]MCZ1266842.1 flagellar basal body rod protein FlgB [Paenibacillus tundrae]MDN4601107.1 flagellar basal body rod protein FlgB [Paenibacillus vandeheii]MDN8589686.1 flagellar basal body rod protein FlgB [Paenibacillus sp. 11B]